MDYFGARFYDPEVGVWTSTDPDEQFFNLYSYCGGNPIIYVDPNGKFSWIGFAIGATIGGVGGLIGEYQATGDWGKAFLFSLGTSLAGGIAGAAIGEAIESRMLERAMNVVAGETGRRAQASPAAWAGEMFFKSLKKLKPLINPTIDLARAVNNFKELSDAYTGGYEETFASYSKDYATNPEGTTGLLVGQEYSSSSSKKFIEEYDIHGHEHMDDYKVNYGPTRDDLIDVAVVKRFYPEYTSNDKWFIRAPDGKTFYLYDAKPGKSLIIDWIRPKGTYQEIILPTLPK